MSVPDSDPVVAYRAWNAREAAHVCHLLGDADIEARIASDAVESVIWSVPYQSAVSPVLVRRADLAAALKVIEEYELVLCGDKPAPSTDADLFCYHCGEAVEGKVDQCPHCQARLDWPAEGPIDQSGEKLKRMLVYAVYFGATIGASVLLALLARRQF